MGKAKLSALKPDATNANKGTERGRYAIETSLRKYGAGRSILLDKHGHIIAGNKTAEVAADVGIDDVLIVQTDGRQLVAVQRTDLDIDSPEGRGLAYADNRAGELSLSWDAEQVLADIQAGIDLSAFWQQNELDELLAEIQPEAGIEDAGAQVDRAEELRVKWGVETGQLWQLGEHRLICGDCTDAATVARVMGGEKAALCVTSPPYNAGDSEKLTNNTHTDETKYVAGGSDNLSHGEYLSLLMSSTSLALAMCDLVVVNLQMLAGNKMAVIEFLYEFRRKFADVAVWVKDTPQPAMARRVMTSAFEYLWFFSADDSPTRAIGTNDFRGTVPNVYSAPSQRENEFFQVHAATYPVHLPSWVLSNFGRAGETIYDPFLGSGTTLIACEQLGRRCRAVEISPGYVAVALERWATSTGKTPVLLDRIP